MENRHIDVSAAPINQWWLVGVFVAVGAVVGVVYSLLTGGTFKIGVAVGASIAGGIALFEVGYVHHARGRWLRRAPLALFLVISMAVWFTVMTFSLEVLPYWLGDVSDDHSLVDGRLSLDRIFQADLLFSVMVGVIITAVMRLRSLIGGRVLFEFLTGRYRRPVDERRIFLFLDLCDSTPIAESLGSTGYHAFLRDFIETLEKPIARYGGEIYQYVGDEVLATWPVRDREANSRAIRCHFAMAAAVSRTPRGSVGAGCWCHTICSTSRTSPRGWPRSPSVGSSSRAKRNRWSCMMSGAPIQTTVWNHQRDEPRDD